MFGILYSLDQKPQLLLIHHAMLCSFYLRAAAVQDTAIIKPSCIVKSFANVRALRKVRFIRSTNN